MKKLILAVLVAAVASPAFAGNYAGMSANGGFTSPDDIHAGVTPKSQKGLNKMAVPHAAIQSTPMATPQKTPQGTPTINAPQAVPTKTPSYSVPTVKQQLTPQAVPTKAPQITGASYRAYVNQLQAANPVSSINVAVSSLKPSTPVNVTVNGVTKTTTAGVIAAVSPTTQIAVPHVPAFATFHTGNSGNHGKGGHSSGSGDNNGQDNAHNNAMGRASGVGGHSEFR